MGFVGSGRLRLRQALIPDESGQYELRVVGIIAKKK
jgi:hypothetical protein